MTKIAENGHHFSRDKHSPSLLIRDIFAYFELVLVNHVFRVSPQVII